MEHLILPAEQVEYGVHIKAPRRRANAPGLGTEGASSMQHESIPVGLCQCGCGRATDLAVRTDPRSGAVKGQPNRFVRGHHCRQPDYHVDDAGCWIWAKHVGADGYGKGRAQKVGYLAHRAYWEREHGPVPDGLDLHHECGKPACVNPSHLTPITRGEHVRLHRPSEIPFSRHVGVTWSLSANKWRARLGQQNLGVFDDEDGAVRALAAAREREGWAIEAGDREAGG